MALAWSGRPFGEERKYFGVLYNNDEPDYRPELAATITHRQSAKTLSSVMLTETTPAISPNFVAGLTTERIPGVRSAMRTAAG